MTAILDFSRVVIASRHVGLVTWLSKAHPQIAARAIYDPSVRAHNLNADTAVIGSWPSHIVHAAGAYFTVEFTRKPTQAEMNAEEMIAHGAHLKRWYLLDDADLEAIRNQAVDDYHNPPSNEPQPLVDLRPFRA